MTPQIYCIQEPNDYKGNVNGFRGLSTFFVKADRIRAAIIIPKTDLFQAWAIPELSSGDVSTITLSSEIKELDGLMITSAYCDINKEIPEVLNKTILYAHANDKKLIIGADANAHSYLWGDSENSRGEAFEQLIFAHNLELLNDGLQPTFTGRGTSTFIDITLTKGIPAGVITNWTVHSKDMHSDHRLISYDLKLDCGSTNELPIQLIIKRIDWVKFRTNLDLLIKPSSQENLSAEWAEAEADALEKGVWEAAICSQHDMIPRANKTKKPPFWSAEVDTLRRKSRRLYKIYIANHDEDDRANYNAAKKQFEKGVKAAKKAYWKEKTGSIDSPKEMAGLQRSLNRSENMKVRLSLNNINTSTPSALADHFIDTLFPGSLPLAGVRAPTNYNNCRSTSEETPLEGTQFITKDLIKHFIKSFQPNKAAGLDRIKPILLKNLTDTALDRLTQLYRVCLAIGFVPGSWCKSKVVIIPKAGKKDYSNPKSFRPISLMPFFFKLLEKVIKHKIESEFLTINPLHSQQHAFRSGFSCDTALSEVADTIESAIMRNQYALGIFLDISGAFDNLTTSAAVQGLADKNVDSKIIKWYKYYLENRSIVAEINGIQVRRRLTRGTPQGGVLSPLIWNLAFDRLLQTCNQGPIKLVGFADDACILIKGQDPHILVDLAQQSINTSIEWGANAGLEFNASKTAAILFTHKRKIPTINKLKIGNQTVDYQKETRYLGIDLDSKLTYKTHIEGKIKKAKQFLMTFRGAIGQLWGPSPRMTIWAYNAMIKPMVTYGSIIWGHKITKNNQKINKLQRLAMLLTTNVVKSTPTAGLEVILGLAPLYLHIHQCSVSAYIRIRGQLKQTWDGLGTGKKRGHRLTHDTTACQIGVNRPLDQNFMSRGFSSNFSLGLPGPADKFTHKVLISMNSADSGHHWKMLVITNNISTHEHYGYISRDSTASQAESWALLSASRYSIELKLTNIHIITDLAHAYNNLRGECKLLTSKKCFDSLNDLGLNTRVLISYKKDPSGLAWKTLKEDLIQDHPTNSTYVTLPLEANRAKSKVIHHFQSIWGELWANPDPAGFQYRQTRRFWPVIDLKTSKEITTKLDRTTLSHVIQLATGHGYNNYHLSLKNSTINGECRLCMEDEEDTWHIVMECPALQWLRDRIFKSSGDHTPTLSCTNDNLFPGRIMRLPSFVREESVAFLFSPPGID